MNPSESLMDPADYANINITSKLKEAGFAKFAAQVCDERLSRISLPHGTIQQLLPELSENAEAEKLGIDARVRGIRRELASLGTSQDLLNKFDELEPLQAYMIGYWGESQGTSLVELVEDRFANPGPWMTRLGNYQHSMLYTLKRLRPGLRKYYCGWDTYIQLADGNVRYLLELVTETLQLHINDGKSLLDAVSPETQTRAAQKVGQSALTQLPGSAAEGSQLTKLVLGLGRVLQVMASQPQGHTPEVNQFRILLDQKIDITGLLNSAVMNLAFVRFPGDKMRAVSGETKDFDYQLHPIFAPVFVYSHRRKRRMNIDALELRGLIDDPAKTIVEILSKANRSGNSPELPEQLELFRDFYDQSSE